MPNNEAKNLPLNGREILQLSHALAKALGQEDMTLAKELANKRDLAIRQFDWQTLGETDLQLLADAITSMDDSLRTLGYSLTQRYSTIDRQQKSTDIKTKSQHKINEKYGK
jgi:hypothetical protein